MAPRERILFPLEVLNKVILHLPSFFFSVRKVFRRLLLILRIPRKSLVLGLTALVLPSPTSSLWMIVIFSQKVIPKEVKAIKDCLIKFSEALGKTN